MLTVVAYLGRRPEGPRPEPRGFARRVHARRSIVCHGQLVQSRFAPSRCYVYIYIYVYIRVNRHVYIHIYVYVRIYIYTCTCTHVFLAIVLIVVFWWQVLLRPSAGITRAAQYICIYIFYAVIYCLHGITLYIAS